MPNALLIPFLVRDLHFFGWWGPPRVTPDGGLDWGQASARMAQTEAGGSDPAGADNYAWCLTVADHTLVTHTLGIDVLTRAPALPAGKVARLWRVLRDLDTLDSKVREAVPRAYGDPQFATSLVPDLLAGLDRPYLDALFGARARPDAITAQEFLRGLTLCRVGYQAGDGAGEEAGTESFVLDFRLLVAFLTDADRAHADGVLRYGGRYDVTNQVLAAKFSPDGELRDLVVES